jgi:hypothetical protein
MYNTIMMIVNVVLSIAIYFSLTACGFQPPEEQTVSKVSSEQKQKDTEESSSKDEEEAEEDAVFNFEESTVPGYYKTGCLTENYDYVKYDLEITENQTVYMAIYNYDYYDINCSFSAVASTYRKFKANFIDEKIVNFSVEATLITFYAQGEVLIANSLKLYGFSSWVKDVPKDVSGLKIAPYFEKAEYSKGDMLYLTYSSTETTFKLSPPEDEYGDRADSPENRTRKLDDRKFVKVK